MPYPERGGPDDPPPIDPNLPLPPGHVITGFWRWITHYNPNTCLLCDALNGVEAEDGQPFWPGIWAGPKVYFTRPYGPPAHPNCRCEAVFRPDAGQLLGWFCDGYDLIGVYANGAFGWYTYPCEVNSWHCGYEEDPDHPPAGTLLYTTCVNADKYGVYADGQGGTYQEPIEINSPDCPLPADYPPYGSLLRTECRGVDLWGWYADGQGGEYDELIQADTESCGGGGGPAPTGPEVPERGRGGGEGGDLEVRLVTEALRG